MERFDDAEVVFKQCITIQQRALGKTHPDTLNTQSGLASLYYKMKKYDKAGNIFSRYWIKFYRVY